MEMKSPRTRLLTANQHAAVGGLTERGHGLHNCVCERENQSQRTIKHMTSVETTNTPADKRDWKDSQ